jgi:uncharacterized delta-60 repeat protein
MKMHTPRRTYSALALIVIFSLSLAFAFASRGLAGETQASQETIRTFLPFLMRGYSYRAAVGVLDPEFNGSGKVVTQFSEDNDVAYAIALQPDGKLVAVGEAYNLGFALARYLPDGSLDTSFGGDGLVTTNLGIENPLNGHAARAIVIQQDSKILVAGRAHSVVGYNIGLARFLPDGSPDTSFGGGKGWVITDLITPHEEGTDLVLQADGKILVAGVVYDVLTDVSDFALLRYNSDGRLDTSFDGDGWLTTDFGSNVDSANGVVLQADGKILVAGSSAAGMALARYTSEGSLDTSFNQDGKVTLSISENTTHGSAISLTYDDKILVAGDCNQFGHTDFALARFLPDGSLDTSFGAGLGYVVTDFEIHHDFAQDITQQPDGKIVLAGLSYWEDSVYTADFALARYDPDGSLDTTFGEDGRVTIDFNGLLDYGYSLVLQPDGKLVVAGLTQSSSSYLTNWNFALVRVK